MSIIQSKPILKEMIWGGDTLKMKRGRKADLIPSQAVGESWEISDPKYSLMLKIINAEADLSIQVHPSDEYVQAGGSQQGKEEAWAILDTRPGARLFCGLKKGVSREQLQKALAEQNTQKITDLLQSYTPEIGDVFHIRPGTIHAIGAGITVAEIQQNSNITYRIFDWNRLGLEGKPRELHLQKAFDVLDFSKEAQETFCIPSVRNLQGLQVFDYIDSEKFSFKKIIPRGGAIPQIDLSVLARSAKPEAFMILFMVKGVARVGNYLLSEWDNILISADSIERSEARIEFYGADCQCLIFQN